MDNLDIGDSLSSSAFPWLPYGASQFSDYQVNGGDLSYFGQQRTAMLEPIIEETSDDDDVSCGHVWTHNDNQWSSESEAGSVIRVELIQGKPTAKSYKNTNVEEKNSAHLCDIRCWTRRFALIVFIVAAQQTISNELHKSSPQCIGNVWYKLYVLFSGVVHRPSNSKHWKWKQNYRMNFKWRQSFISRWQQMH